MAYVELKNVSFIYNGETEPALCHTDISLERGEILLLVGSSGCGKTTLLRLLKPQLRPEGRTFGQILLDGRDITNGIYTHFSSALSHPNTPEHPSSPSSSAMEIGYVSQNPEDQAVTDTVAHELAFGLESAGMEPGAIRRRIGEICGFFGLGELYGKKMSELSGGEVQLVELAAAMAGDPKLLLLDEPTSQLDPIAAGEFLSALRRLNEELGVTIIIAEHRLEDILPMADKVAVMTSSGNISFFGTPRRLSAMMIDNTAESPEGLYAVRSAMPSAVRIYADLESAKDVTQKHKDPQQTENCPLTVREGQKFIEKNFLFSNIENTTEANFPEQFKKNKKRDTDNAWRDTAIDLRNVCFRYDRDLPDVLYGLDLSIREGEIFGIIGGNGAGKTTLMGVIAGLDKPYRGKRHVNGRTACLPQDPRMIFTCDTVAEDLIAAARIGVGSGEDKNKSPDHSTAGNVIKGKADDKVNAPDDLLIANAVMAAVKKFGIGRLARRHPYDLSGGERQKAALAKLLLTGAEILLLDEPTSGLDAKSKHMLGDLLRRLCAAGETVVIVTHDVEFAAAYTDRCGMLFDGKMTSVAETRTFFSENKYYTTAAARIARPFRDITGIDALTVDDVVKICLSGTRKKSAEEDPDPEGGSEVGDAPPSNGETSPVEDINKNTEQNKSKEKDTYTNTDSDTDADTDTGKDKNKEKDKDQNKNKVKGAEESQTTGETQTTEDSEVTVSSASSATAEEDGRLNNDL